jgi:hypothetical protein
MNNKSKKTPQEWLADFEILHRKVGSGDVNVAGARQTAEEFELQLGGTSRSTGKLRGHCWSHDVPRFAR